VTYTWLLVPPLTVSPRATAKVPLNVLVKPDVSTLKSLTSDQGPKIGPEDGRADDSNAAAASYPGFSAGGFAGALDFGGCFFPVMARLCFGME